MGVFGDLPDDEAQAMLDPTSQQTAEPCSCLAEWAADYLSELGWYDDVWLNISNELPRLEDERGGYAATGSRMHKETGRFNAGHVERRYRTRTFRCLHCGEEATGRTLRMAEERIPDSFGLE